MRYTHTNLLPLTVFSRGKGGLSFAMLLSKSHILGNITLAVRSMRLTLPLACES